MCVCVKQCGKKKSEKKMQREKVYIRMIRVKEKRVKGEKKGKKKCV